MSTTLEEIATEAGVSVATVSRTFNRPELVSEATRIKVLAASSRVGNGIPPSRKLGMIVPDASSSFYSQLLYSLDRELFGKGYQLIPASSDGRPEVEMQILERFRAMGVSGIFYIGSRSGSQGVLELISSGDIPVLAYNSEASYGNVDCIVTESRYALQALVDYLLNMGHLRYSYLSGSLDSSVFRERLENFELALARNAHPEATMELFEGTGDFASGRDYAEHFLQLPQDSRPTAVVAANDSMAIGFMQRVQEAGLAIPQDVSVAGFDGTQLAQWCYPALTTIVQPIRRMAREGAALLLDRISNQDESTLTPRKLRVDPRFVARASVDTANRQPNSRPVLRAINSDVWEI